MNRELHEECGVCGVWGHTSAAPLVYQGLHALQHRGQEGAGIAVGDGDTIRCVRGTGLLAEALPPGSLQPLAGPAAIGHVRYGTMGGDERENLQPMVARRGSGGMAVAHNGQIVNAAAQREALERQGSILNSSTDSETSKRPAPIRFDTS